MVLLAATVFAIGVSFTPLPQYSAVPTEYRLAPFDAVLTKIDPKWCGGYLLWSSKYPGILFVNTRAGRSFVVREIRFTILEVETDSSWSTPVLQVLDRPLETRIVLRMAPIDYARARRCMPLLFFGT